jgi:dTDP-L-rhamnose 4-epimerase
MSVRVLVTGGAGFIGSHVVDRLVERGHEVVVLDSLDPQVHAGPPPWLRSDVELVVADVRDRAAVAPLAAGVDVVVHLAAAVGVAQSMYEIERFVDVNVRGTAVVLEACVQKPSRVQKLVLGSSMALYGEGRCRCPACGPFDPALRPAVELARRDFEVRCPRCGAVGVPEPTPEDARLRPSTVYAVTKRDQEELALTVGAAYHLPTVALRLFNVYGPRQSLANPYTGVGAIFSARLLAGRPPLVFEDGQQTRDFTHVSDVAEAFARVVEEPGGDGKALNVGAGHALPLVELGRLIAGELGVEWKPEVTGTFRAGDIRHCTADGGELKRAVRFVPTVDFAHGVKDLVAWVKTQTAGAEGPDALAELRARGLVR